MHLRFTLLYHFLVHADLYLHKTGQEKAHFRHYRTITRYNWHRFCTFWKQTESNSEYFKTFTYLHNVTSLLRKR